MSSSAIFRNNNEVFVDNKSIKIQIFQQSLFSDVMVMFFWRTTILMGCFKQNFRWIKREFRVNPLRHYMVLHMVIVVHLQRWLSWYLISDSHMSVTWHMASTFVLYRGRVVVSKKCEINISIIKSWVVISVNTEYDLFNQQ